MSEQDLVELLIACLVTGNALPAFDTVATELPALHGRADVVAMSSPQCWTREVSLALGVPSAAAIVSSLRRQSPRTVDYVARRTGLSLMTVRTRLVSLERLGVVKRHKSGSYSLANSLSYGEIWAFEAKLTDWNRALYQAIRYTAFADRVVVVMPEKKAMLIKKNAESFRRHSVGVVCVDEDSGAVRTIVPPKKLHQNCAAARVFATAQLNARATEQSS